MTSPESVRLDRQEPAILLVGASPTIQDALAQALSRHGMYVETVSVRRAQRAVVVTAPDLIVLADEAVDDGGVAVLTELAASPLSSVVPVVILHDEPSLALRLQAFRHGVAAVIPRTASVDATAVRLAELTEEIPDRMSLSFGQLGEATLQDFTHALSEQLEASVLPQSGATSGQDVRLVFGGGRPLAKLVDEFVHRVQDHVLHAEALRGEAGEHLGSSSPLLTQAELGAEAGDSVDLSGLRVVLADDDAARADAVAQDLRTRGATVLVSDLDPTAQRFTRFRQLDPSVVVIGEQQVKEAGRALVRRVHGDSRLRWATFLVVQWERVCPELGQLFALDQLARLLAALMHSEQELRRQVRAGEEFDTRLEVTGPARLLYALSDPPGPLRVTVLAPRLRACIDISDKLIVGVTAIYVPDGEQRLEGPAALAALLSLSAGRVRVKPVLQPAVANVMATVDVALSLADQEPQYPVSRPPPGRERAGLSEPTVLTVSAAPAPLVATRETRPGRASAGSDLRIQGVESGPVPERGRDDRRTPTTKPSDDSVSKAALVNQLLVRYRELLQGRPPVYVLVAAGIVLAVVVLLAVAAMRGGPAMEPEPRVQRQAEAAPSASSAGAAPAARPAASKRTRELAPADLPETSNQKTPTCDELLEGIDRLEGIHRGAAYNSMVEGRRALVRGDVKASHRAYCHAIRMDPDNATAQAELARLILIQRDGPAGLERVKRALELDPNSRILQGLLGDALTRVGRHAEARKAWFAEGQLTDAVPDAKQVLLGSLIKAARHQRNRHAWGEAERFFRRVIVLDPGNLEAAIGLARALSALQEVDEARRWNRYVRALSPNNSEAAELMRELDTQK